MELSHDYTKCSSQYKEHSPNGIPLIQAVALTVSNEPVFSFLGRPQNDDLYCPSCKCSVFFRSAHKRKSSEDAEPDTYVRAHFVHHMSKEVDGASSTAISCHNRESQIHIYAKQIVCAMIETVKPIVPSCILCNQAVDIQLVPPPDPKNEIPNYKVVCEYTFAKFRADVAVIVDGKMWCCIEVFNTSKASSQKVDYLNLHKIPWIEVSALALVDALEAQTAASLHQQSTSYLSVPVINCSNHGLCSTCSTTTPFKTRDQAQASLPWFKSLCSVLTDHMASRERFSSNNQHQEEQLALQIQSQEDILAYLKARLSRDNETLKVAKEIVAAEKEIDDMEKEVNIIKSKHGVQGQDEISDHLKARLARCDETLGIARKIGAAVKEIDTIKCRNEDMKHIVTDEDLQKHLAAVSKRRQDLEALEWQNRNEACTNKLVLPFGKHRDHCLEAVWQHDPAYVVWLAGYFPRLSGSRPATHTNSACFPVNVKVLAKSLIRGTCYACHKSLKMDKEWKTFCASCYSELRRE